MTPAEPPASSRDGAAKDVTAGVTLGLVSVPDGLAMGLFAGLNPVAGLYGYLVGTVTGALATSSVLMSVQVTGAMAVLISDVPELHGAQDTARALATLGLLTGAVMLVAGVLRLGTLVRFVPNAVLTGFVNAVAVNIVLIIALERTPLRSLGLLVAVAVASAAAVMYVPFEGVQQLRDVTDIPGSLPRPVLPMFGLVPALLLPAVALAFVGLVQGAAISQTVANPDGTFPDVSGDFRGQGIANVSGANRRSGAHHVPFPHLFMAAAVTLVVTMFVVSLTAAGLSVTKADRCTDPVAITARAVSVCGEGDMVSEQELVRAR